MTNSDRVQRPSQLPTAIATAILAAGIFAFDAFSTFEIAVAALYIVVLLMALRFTNVTGIILIALGCIGLTIIGYLIGHANDPNEGAMLRGAVSALAIAFAAVLCVQIRMSDARLRQSEERYRNIFQSTSVAVWEQDFTEAANACAPVLQQGIPRLRDYFIANEGFLKHCLFLVRTIDANDAAKQLIGDLGQNNVQRSWGAALEPETLAAFREILLAYLAGESSFTIEAAIRAVNGELRTTIVTATFPSDRSRSVLINSLDVTAKIAAERALQNSMAELTRVSRIATLGALTASIGHEVNQPLAAVVTNAEAALRWLSRERPDIGETTACLKEVVQEGRRAGDIIHRLRSLAVKGELVRGPVDINAIVTQVLAMAQRDLAQHQIAAAVDLTPDLPTIAGDAVQLQQVLMNLVNNAVHAMRVSATKELKLRSAFDPAGGILVTVRDSGSGIPDDHMQRLFAPFFTTKAEGMGIGLSISRSIIESHHGRIWAERNEGGGTTFHFMIPTATAAGSGNLA
jgi:signal transduction histidine kinase